MTDLADFRLLLSQEHGLCVITTIRPNITMQASVVTAGVMAHPVSGIETVGFVAAGLSRKLENLRERPQVTVVARAGWQWAAVEGTADLIGPDDPTGFDGQGVRQLLRDVFIQAGGTHDDWAEYDRVMAEQRRTAVFIVPTRIYSNG
jgi:PPOX class probable F420-dependent enzyme